MEVALDGTHLLTFDNCCSGSYLNGPLVEPFYPLPVQVVDMEFAMGGTHVMTF